jgi:hypothetical protein
MRIPPLLLCLLIPTGCVWSDTSSEAESLYQHTDYQASLKILSVETEFFEKALALNPRS